MIRFCTSRHQGLCAALGPFRFLPELQGPTFNYQNHLLGRLPVNSTWGLVQGTYKNYGVGSQWCQIEEGFWGVPYKNYGRRHFGEGRRTSTRIMHCASGGCSEARSGSKLLDKAARIHFPKRSEAKMRGPERLRPHPERSGSLELPTLVQQTTGHVLKPSKNSYSLNFRRSGEEIPETVPKLLKARGFGFQGALFSGHIQRQGASC